MTKNIEHITKQQNTKPTKKTENKAQIAQNKQQNNKQQITIQQTTTNTTTQNTEKTEEQGTNT